MVQVEARLKNETSVDRAAELLVSTHQKADTRQVPLSAVLSWQLNGSDVTVNFSCHDSPDTIRAQARRDLSPVGKARTITRGEPGGTINADYGAVSTVPSSIADSISPDSSKTFSLNNWKVTYYPAGDGTYANPPLAQVVIAAGQANNRHHRPQRRHTVH